MSDKIKEIFSKVTGTPKEAINKDFKRNSNGWDSFNHLILIMELSEATEISVSAKKSAEIENYGDLESVFKGK
ncbi:MAG: acyl carrier protein [Helicobacteraceae bacterium]|jgi:acyl carrier protein|nr:acyl carrier protein [Helicobacteraceae bacterium]